MMKSILQQTKNPTQLSKPISPEADDDIDHPPLAPSPTSVMGDDPETEGAVLAEQAEEDESKRKARERKQLEEAMRVSMDKYSDALESTFDEIKYGKPTRRRDDSG